MTSPFTRRAFTSSLVGLSACATPGMADDGAGAKLYADVERYVAFGPKRTASAADRAVSTWLAREAEALGAEVTLQPFFVRQFDVARAELSVGATTFEALPFWFPRASASPIEARLQMLSAVRSGELALSVLPAGLAGLRAMPVAVLQAARSSAAGLVLVTPTPSGLLFAHGQSEECALPTLVVGAKDGAALQAAAAAGAMARFVLQGEVRPRAEAFNVIARLGQGERLIGVSTPTSAWLTSGGERGPGVALWLNLLRRAARSSSARWLFVAASGHELDAAGARAFVASPHAPAQSGVALWFHLGASIATRRFSFDQNYAPTAHDEASGDSRLIANNASLVERLGAKFSTSAYTPTLREASAARGEYRLYAERGYPTCGFEGAHAYFHTPADLAQTTTPALLGDVYRRLDRTFTAFGA
jgi:hypothetical protein